MPHARAGEGDEKAARAGLLPHIDAEGRRA
jgi:hypothetical protein